MIVNPPLGQEKACSIEILIHKGNDWEFEQDPSHIRK